MIRITEESFELMASKLQEELAGIIEKGLDVDDYKLIMYKYIFISELKIPLLEDLGVEIGENSFVLYIVPDDLEFGRLRHLDDVFDKFESSFEPNDYNVIKLRFKLCD